MDAEAKIAELEVEYENCQKTLAELRKTYRETEDRMKNIEGQYTVLAELAKDAGKAVVEPLPEVTEVESEPGEVKEE